MAYGIDLKIVDYPEYARSGDLVTVKWYIRVNLTENLDKPIIRFIDLKSYELLGWEQLAVLPSGTYDTPITETTFMMKPYTMNILAEVLIENRQLEWERKYDDKTFKIMLIY